MTEFQEIVVGALASVCASATLAGIYYAIKAPIFDEWNSGGAPIKLTFPYPAKVIFSFVFAAVFGAALGIIVTVPMLILRETRFLPIVLFSFVLGVLCFAKYYHYHYHRVRGIWNDEYTIESMTKGYFRFAIDALPISILVGIAIWFVRARPMIWLDP